MTTIQQVLHKHRHWLSRSDGIARELKYLKEDLSEGSLSALYNISDSLGGLAVYYGINGLIAVSDGAFSGWKDISKALTYRYWALRIRSQTFFKTSFLRSVKTIPNLTNHMGNAGCLLGFFIAIDKDDQASSVADVLEGMLTIEGAVDSKYLQKRKFEPFMMWLYSIYSGKPISSKIKIVDLAIYQNVIDCWDDSEAVSSALDKLCSYHLLNANDAGGDWDPEFKNPPFDLLPLEIQAVSLVRKKLGLGALNVNHPLFSLATSSIEHLSFISDDLLLEVESVVNSFYGS